MMLFQTLAVRMTESAIKRKTIENRDRDLYLYAYEGLLAHVASWESIVILSVFLEVFVETVIYMAFYISLRSMQVAFTKLTTRNVTSLQ